MTGRRRIAGIALGLVWVLGASAVASAAARPHARASRHGARNDGKPKGGGPSKSEVGRQGSASGVSFTVLPGDTHAKLAADLTSADGNEKVLRRLDPTLTPGDKIKIPEELLRPGLSDSRREALVCGRSYPTLWSVARRAGARSAADVGRTARNLQRMNAILVASRVAPGTKILVPKSWLDGVGAVRPEGGASAPAKRDEPPLPSAVQEAQAASVEPVPFVPETAEGPALPPPAAGAVVVEPAAREGAPTQANARRSGPFEIVKTYLAKDFDGLDRKGAHLPDRLRHFLGEKEYAQAHLDRGAVNLVVLHTTEHSGSTFENTANYIRRKRLANYILGPDGTAYEVVPEEYRAYGCGDSVWDGRYVVDLEAINIEIFANTEKGSRQGVISDAQYAGLKALLDNIRSRRPQIDESRVVTHKMVALNLKLGTRSRKGDPYEFQWEKAGLPDNSKVADRDVLDGRAKICTDCRFTDRVTVGQTEAAKLAKKL